VQSMKAFAHPDRGQRSTADINTALRNTLTVATNELKYVAKVESELGDIPAIPCFLSDLNQVFLNLLVNAAHAIGDVVGRSGQRGTIKVRTYVEKDNLVIAIGDTGTGIPPAVQSRVFEPFFTTKDVGKGTGQGLALARSVVVEQHGGSITFETAMGKGTTFFVRLPVSPP
jgi:two-component system, NtrC family, sensor kinase